MLVITRRLGERIAIGDDIEIIVTAVSRKSVRLAVSAPEGTLILRGEVRDSVEAANRAAAESDVQDSFLKDHLPKRE